MLIPSTHTRGYILLVYVCVHAYILLPIQVKLHVDVFLPLCIRVCNVLYVCTYVLAFFMILCVRMCVHVFCTL